MKILLALLLASATLTACGYPNTIHKKCVDGYTIYTENGTGKIIDYYGYEIEDPDHYCAEDKNFWAYTLKRR